MSQQISTHELFSTESDEESNYSMDGYASIIAYILVYLVYFSSICRYDPEYLGPAPTLNFFPRFKTKPKPKSVPRFLQLTKKGYYALREAAPHEVWFCEFPHCDQTFLPFLSFGTRHHCRACGMTVCANHSTPNMTLPSHLIPAYQGDLSSLSTPVLATSVDPGLLPEVVTLKYACMLCCDKALGLVPKQPKFVRPIARELLLLFLLFSLFIYLFIYFCIIFINFWLYCI